MGGTNSDTSDRELVFSRVFDAPRDLVFEAWSSPEHLAKWWGPNGFSITTHEFTFKPGGKWRLTMHGPDGVDYPNEHVYDEIVVPERIVHTHRGEIDGIRADFQHITTFAAEGDKTRITMRLVFPTALALKQVNEKAHADEGGRQTLERLAEAIGSGAVRRPLELNISRTFDAPRELVFEAWTKAEHLSRWFTPKPLTTPMCEVDFRPGGVFRLVMRTPNGIEFPFDARFGDIDPPNRLVFRGRIHDDNESETTVTFSETGGKTTMRVRQTYSFESDATRGAQQGWTATLDQLGEHVAQRRKMHAP